MADRDCSEVERVPLASLTRADFEERFQRRNLPVVLTGVTDSWRCAREWLTPAGTPDLKRLASLFGSHVVTVHGERGRDGKRSRSEMTVGEYADWWTRRTPDSDPLYLKDWSLARLEPGYGAYETPACLGEDWLNEHWAAAAAEEADDTSSGDHRFVYVGPASSRTGIHADVLFSYSWSVNVVGSKRWLLVPDEQRHLVSDEATQPLKIDLADLLVAGGSSGGDGGGSKKRRLSSDGSGEAGGGVAAVRPLEVVQQAGELLFVPSGWYHQVENLTDCISVNHNWLNAHNAHWALLRLKQVLASVKSGLGEEEAEDSELCEQLLERRAGMSLGGLCDLLEGVLVRRRQGTEEQAQASAELQFECERAASVLREALGLITLEYAQSLESEDMPERAEAVERQQALLLDLEAP